MSNYKPGTWIALFIGAHFAHHLLTALVVPLLPYIRDGFELSYAQAGIVVSAFTLSYGFAQLPAGWLADRVGRARLITVGIAGVAAAGAVAGVTTSYWGLIAALILMGIAGGGYHPSASPLITASVPPERKGRALGLHLVGGSASHFATPLLGAAIASQFGFHGAFLGISLPVLLFGIAFFLILRSRGEQRWSAGSSDAAASIDARGEQSDAGPGATPGGDAQVDSAASEGAARGSEARHAGPALPAGATESAARAPAADARPDTAAGESGRRTIVRISVFLFMTSIVGAVIASVTAFMPLYLVDAFGLSEGLAAGALSLFYATGVVAAPAGGMLSDRFGPVPILVGLSVATGPLLMLAARVPAASLFVLILVVIGVGQFFRMPVSESYLSHDVPDRLRSTVLGVYFFAGMEASGLLTPILGGLIDAWGFTRAFMLAGVALTVLATVSAAMLYRMHAADAPVSEAMSTREAAPDRR